MAQMSGMDVVASRELAARFASDAQRLEAMASQLESSLARAAWQGGDAVDFQQAWRGRLRPTLTSVAASLRDASSMLGRQASEQESTSEQRSDRLGAGRTGGWPGGGLLLMVPTSPINNPLLRYLVGLFSPGTRADGDAVREGERQSDRTAGSERFPGRSFDNDWAGRTILANYLAGGPDLRIHNDPEWSEYMMSIDMLRNGGVDGGQNYEGMAARNDRQAQAALKTYLSGGGTDGSFDETFSMAIPNGESMTGVNYLHGTNADVGGFKHAGTTKVEPLPDGTYRVSLDVTYQWNDRIDPNDQYSSDVQKNSWAEVLTLGRADAYDIHLGWSSPTAVIVDAQGQVVRREGGWPA